MGEVKERRTDPIEKWGCVSLVGLLPAWFMVLYAGGLLWDAFAGWAMTGEWEMVTLGQFWNVSRIGLPWPGLDAWLSQILEWSAAAGLLALVVPVGWVGYWVATIPLFGVAWLWDQVRGLRGFRPPSGPS